MSFRITEAQLQKLGQEQRDGFRERMVPYFQSQWPAFARSHGEEGLRGWLDSGLDVAKQAGFVTERDVAQLLLLMMHLGADPGQPPAWVDAILREGRQTPEGRLRRIIEQANLGEDEQTIVPFEEFRS